MTNTRDGKLKLGDLYETKQGVRTKHRNWEELYQALAAFKARNGHFDLGGDHEDSGLACFVAKLRRCRDDLTDMQRQKLNSIGFDLSNMVERQERSWLQKWERLKEFRRLFGHANVPQSAITDDSMEPWANELGSWVCHQRTIYRKGKLSKERVSKLNQIGFEFSLKPHTKVKDSTTDDHKWHVMYLQLVQHKQKHGDVNPSKPHRSSSNNQKQRKLASWCNTQRALNAAGELKPDRHHLLQEMGFVWKVEKGASEPEFKVWMDNYAVLCKFQAKNGHTVVNSKHPAFFWCHGQRRLYRKGTMIPERQELLNKIGFNWESLKRGWNMKNPATNHKSLASELRRKRQLGGQIGGRRNRPTEQNSDDDQEDEDVNINGEPEPKRQRTSSSNTSGNTASGPATKEAPAPAREDVMAIGTRVAVYWSDDEEFYEGQVTKKHKSNGTFFVEYDDGDEEWVDFQKSEYRRLDSDGNHVAQAAAVVSDDSIISANNHKAELVQQVTKGTRVSVWWPAEKEYYDGTVMKICSDIKNPHYIWYDDGDSQQTNLMRLKFKLLEPQDDDRDDSMKRQAECRLQQGASYDSDETDDEY